VGQDVSGWRLVGQDIWRGRPAWQGRLIEAKPVLTRHNFHFGPRITPDKRLCRTFGGDAL